jgi:hypothetical protein
MGTLDDATRLHTYRAYHHRLNAKGKGDEVWKDEV